MIRMSEEYLRGHWTREDSIKLRKKTYRVGKMSYGDYFLEEKKDWKLTENDLHSKDTLWPEKELKNSQFTHNYII